MILQSDLMIIKRTKTNFLPNIISNNNNTILYLITSSILSFCEFIKTSKFFESKTKQTYRHPKKIATTKNNVREIFIITNLRDIYFNSYLRINKIKIYNSINIIWSSWNICFNFSKKSQIAKKSFCGILIGLKLRSKHGFKISI